MRSHFGRQTHNLSELATNSIGECRISAMLADHGALVWCLDSSRSMLMSDRGRLARFGNRVHLRRANAEKTGLGSNKFDLVVCGQC